jgi:hypothetical protein
MARLHRGWLVAVAAIATVGVIGVSIAGHASKGSSTARASADQLAPLRQFLARLDHSSAAFDAHYTQTAPDGTASEYRLVRQGAQARFENTALGQHVVVISSGSTGWRCTGREGQPATHCAAEDVADFTTRYDPRNAATMLPQLLGVGGSELTFDRATDTVAGEAVDCTHFTQPRPGRKLDGRVCVTADGILASDEFGSKVRLASISRTVNAALFVPPTD